MILVFIKSIKMVYILLNLNKTFIYISSTFILKLSYKILYKMKWMEILRNFITVIIAIFLLSFTFSVDNAQAELTNASAFKFKSRVNNGTWQDNTTVSTHSSAAWYAIGKLNATSSNIHVSSSSSPNINVRSIASHKDGWFGYWSPNLNNAVSGGTIYYNVQTTTAKNFTQCNYNKLALHEFGHAMGMVHQDAANFTVMKQGQYCYSDYSSLDKDNLIYQYGR